MLIIHKIKYILFIVFLVFCLVLAMLAALTKRTNNKTIKGNEMIKTIEYQTSLGPRFLTAPGHVLVQKFIVGEMGILADDIIIQRWEHAGTNSKVYKLENIIGRFSPNAENRIIIAVHYDSKKFADKDKINPEEPVPGANDSASGVAVLIKLARYLAETKTSPNIGIDLVFFDGEEGEENLDDTPWRPLGSVYFSKNIKEVYADKLPIGGIVLDMVCDKDLKIYYEKQSYENAPEQIKKFWGFGNKNYPDNFIEKIKHEIIDDHTALNKIGIPSFLVIDFDYPYFHTTEDTVDKCAAESLEKVLNTLLDYLYTF